MDYVIERMALAGCSEIRVVTRPEKRDVIRRARELGAAVIEAKPASVAASLARGLDATPGQTRVLFGFPDSIWEPRDGFSKLLAAIAGEHDLALGLFRSDEGIRSDVVTVDGQGLVTGVAVKPANPQSNLIWGCGAARARALSGLGQADEPGRYFDMLCRRQPVAGVELSDQWVDVGTREGLARGRAEKTGNG